MNFHLYDIKNLKEHSDVDPQFPSKVVGWDNSEINLCANATHFGYVFSGSLKINYEGEEYIIKKGMYFSIPDKAILNGHGKGVVMSRLGVRGLFSMGGKVEHKGRLKYIDGCYDTLLIAPVIKGDPCLNFLYMPNGVNQTRHVHPSVRIGIVLSGSGICKTPANDYPLSEGKIFIMETDCEHSFHTQKNELRILIYHPDSDFGSTNDNHPIINRTIVDGVSASKIDNIRTK